MQKSFTATIGQRETAIVSGFAGGHVTIKLEPILGRDGQPRLSGRTENFRMSADVARFFAAALLEAADEVSTAPTQADI